MPFIIAVIHMPPCFLFADYLLFIVCYRCPLAARRSDAAAILFSHDFRLLLPLDDY